MIKVGDQFTVGNDPNPWTVTWIGEPFVFPPTAKAIEAGTVETERLDPTDESAGRRLRPDGSQGMNRGKA